MACSGVNDCCEQEEKLTNDGVDVLFQVVREFTEQVGTRPSLFKADVDSAYRRVPLKASDRLELQPLFISQLRVSCRM